MANAWAMGIFLQASGGEQREILFKYENPLIPAGVALTSLWAAMLLWALLRGSAIGRSGVGSHLPREEEAQA